MFKTNQTLATLIAESRQLADAIKEGKLQARANPESVAPQFRPVIEAMNAMADAFVAPINVTAEYVGRISKGDIPPKITDTYRGDFNEIKNNLNQCIDALSGLIGEMNHMSREHDAGDIDVAIPADKFQGAYREMGEGVNKMVAGHIAVKKKAMACITEFGKGNFDAALEKFPGKKAFINDTIEQLRTNLKAVLAETSTLIKATQDGKLQTRGNAQQFAGGWGELVGGVNQLIEAFVAPINVTAEYVDRISKGDIPPKITDTYRGDFNEIKNNLNVCIEVMNGLLRETSTLIKATQDGKLQTRGNAQQFAGGWGELVGGVNQLIEAFVAPINVTAEYVDRISKGDIPPKITDNYSGDFNEIKNNLNACIEVMNGLLQETNTLIKATQDGKLQTRGNAQQFAGGWGELVGGVNRLIDAFVAPINVTAEYVDRISKGDIPPKITDNYNGDFNEIKNNLNACIEVMNGLLRETNTLIKATQDGKLQTRGNAQQFAGGWGELVGGVNRLIDAFVAPINVTAEYVDRISKGDIPPKITDTYNGDFNEIKNNLNACIEVLDHMMELCGGTASILQAMAGKDFSRTVEAKYPGVFGTLKDNANLVVEILRAVLTQITEMPISLPRGCEPLAESAQTLAQGCSTHSASVEQLTASTEELARSVNAVKENANALDPSGGEVQPTGRRGRQGGTEVDRIDGADPLQFAADQRDHPGDLGDRQPDESIGLECGHRGSPRRRTRHGIRRRGRRGTETG